MPGLLTRLRGTHSPITRLSQSPNSFSMLNEDACSSESEPLGSKLPVELDHEVRKMLEDCDCFTPEVARKFAQHNITAPILHTLNDSDLKELGFNTIGDRKRFLQLLNSNNRRHSRLASLSIETTTQESIPSGLNQTIPHFFHNKDPVKVSLLRLLFSALYAFLAVGVTSFVMVLVHEKVPDIGKYPPLPDIILDNIPYISWAFEATEFVGLVLTFIWILVLVFHRHRFILMRRQFSLFGTVFLLRSVTMYITSLSVPGKHLAGECKAYVFDSMAERLARALEIWFGFGMTIRGVRTCGDYMFSGHTTCLTLLNFFITEYTPSTFVSLHILSWMLNAFGVFFILAAHEHYSIDVFIAVYITSRLFLYYHTLANNTQFLLDSHNNQRTVIWFPLFHFFEGDVRGVVPNEFENPFSHYTSLQQFINDGTNECFVKESPNGHRNRKS